MLLILLHWIIIAFITLSFGNIFIAAWSKLSKRDESYSTFDSFWLGLGAISIILMGISLFAPINIYVLAALLATSTVYWSLHIQKLSSTVKGAISFVKSLSGFTKFGLAICIVPILIYSLSTPTMYDQALYHTQSMTWTDSYSIVPGLANLHGRFGFNSSFLLLSTLFNYHPSYFTPYYTLNGLCMLIFCCWVLGEISKKKSISEILILSAILLLSIFIFGDNLSSTSTDTLAHIIISYIFINYISSEDNLKNRSLIMGFLPIFCITLKLSSAIILLMCLWAIILFLKNKEYRPTITLISIGILVASLWCTRFVILTGYLVYPFPEIDLFSFDWKVPTGLISEEKDAAYAWARISNAPYSEVLSMSVTEWVPIWLKRQSYITILLMGLLIISPLAIFFQRRNTNKKAIIIVWSIALLGCLFWFFTAPDIRFGLAMVLTCAFIPYWGLRNFIALSDKKIMKYRKLAYLPLFIIPIWITNLSLKQLKAFKPDDRPALSYMLYPESTDRIKITQHTEFNQHIIDEVIFYTPKKGNQCFDQCLPCLPYFDKRIEMRGEGLDKGFKMRNKTY